MAQAPENGKITNRMIYDMVIKHRDETHKAAKETIETIHEVDKKVTTNEANIKAIRADTDTNAIDIKDLRKSSNRWDGIVALVTGALATIGLIKQ